MTEIPDRYSERLLLTADHEVWLIHWQAGHDTGFTTTTARAVT
jgi:hypothetical protein